MPVSDIVLAAAEIMGTIAFALSGAMVAIDRRLDLFGVLFLAVTTALGGGTIRDILIGKLPPGMFYNYYYVAIAILSALLLFIWVSCRVQHYLDHRRSIDRILNLFDAIGLGVFSVVGTQTGIDAGHGANAFFCVFLGMTTGVGGGILRDLLARQTPYVFVKHIYAIAAIVGALLYFALVQWLHVDPSVAVFIAIGTVTAIRMLSSRFQWDLPKVKLPGPNRF